MTLVAHPDTGWTLGAWGGACSGTGACTVAMNEAKSVTADFLPPPPTPGQSANLALSDGTVQYKVPGAAEAVTLVGATQIPIGSQVDTTDGAADVTVARGATLDTSEFYSGQFTVLQPGPRSLGVCASTAAASSTASRRSGRSPRRSRRASCGARAKVISGREGASRRRPCAERSG